MKQQRFARLPRLLVLGLMFAGGPAMAQTPPQDTKTPPAMTPYGMMMPMMGMQGAHPGMMMPMMGGGMMGGGMMGMMMTHPDGYIAFLKTELGITEAQNDLWTAYTSQLQTLVKQHMETMPMMMGAPDAKPLGWIDRMTQMQTRMGAHLEAMKAVLPAATALYAALTPEQKLKADALMPGGMGMMGGMMGGMPKRK